MHKVKNLTLCLHTLKIAATYNICNQRLHYYFQNFFEKSNTSQNGRSKNYFTKTLIIISQILYFNAQRIFFIIDNNTSDTAQFRIETHLYNNHIEFHS